MRSEVGEVECAFVEEAGVEEVFFLEEGLCVVWRLYFVCVV